MTTILVTSATGDTGRPTVRELLKKGLKVRALARQEDARSRDLASLGAEIVYGGYHEPARYAAGYGGRRSRLFLLSHCRRSGGGRGHLRAGRQRAARRAHRQPVPQAIQAHGSPAR